MPSTWPEEEIIAGGECVMYQEMELKQDDMELRVDHFWHKIFWKIVECGDHFELLPNLVKCALALIH